jgi:hypothetical protein
MLIYCTGILAEATTPNALYVYDVYASASDVAFQDFDLDPDELGGELTWSPPFFTDIVTTYRIYLALDVAGADRSGLVQELPVGTNVYHLASQSMTSTVLKAWITCSLTVADSLVSIYYNGVDLTSQVTGDFNSWIDPKYVTFEKIEGAYFTATASCIQGVTTIADASVMCGFQMSCDDEITTGESDWEGYGSDDPIDTEHASGGGTGWSSRRPSAMSAYLLTDSSAGKIWGTMQPYAAMRRVSGAVTTGRNVSFTHFTVYTKSEGGEQTTPAGVLLSDLQSVVSLVSFNDADLDDETLGGSLTFLPPTALGQVTGFNVYMAMDAVGAGRSQIGVVDSADDEFPVPAGERVGNFTHLLVYARSSLGEQSTPAAQAIFNDFEAVCGSIEGLNCGVAASAGMGACSPSAGCSDCGLTQPRIQAVEEAVVKSSVSIIGTQSDFGTQMAQEHLMGCGVDYGVTYYSVRPAEGEETAPGSEPIICRYSCMTDMSTCRTCKPVTNSGSVSSPDADGLSIWNYLGCKYLGLSADEVTDETRQYSYVFSDGRYVGEGSAVQDQLSCGALALQTADVSPFSLANLEVGCPAGMACSLSMR